MRIPALTGVVLAGGRSRRMGRNKATLRASGELLWRRQMRLLKAAGAAPVFVALRPRQRSLGLRVTEIRDPVKDAGPLAGLQVGLQNCTSPWLAVLAVDMPKVGGDWFRRLFRRCRPGRGAVFRGPDGFEPLAAIYPREALAEATRRLQGRDLAVHRLVAALVRAGQMTVLPLPARLRSECTNWNLPKDFGRLKETGTRSPRARQARSKPTARATSS